MPYLDSLWPQISSPSGSKRKRTDSDISDREAGTGRMFPAYEAGATNLFPPIQSTFPPYRYASRSSRLTRPFRFPKFRQLPTELRLMIWRRTWVARAIRPTRTLEGTQDMATSVTQLNNGRFGQSSLTRIQHANIARYFWGALPDTEEVSASFFHVDYQFITVTSAQARPPIALWINQESRQETLRHYSLCLALAATEVGQTKVYFNFDLDRLVYPVHNPLSTSFWMGDMSRLRNLTIPELAPALPDYVKNSGPWSDDKIEHPQKFDHKEPVMHEDFDLLWYVLRKFFPALRNIRLEPFHRCSKYVSSSESKLTDPIRLEVDAELEVDEDDEDEDGWVGYDYGADEADGLCHACFDLQARVWDLPQATDHNLYKDPGVADYKRVLEDRGITQPIYREETLVIGLAPPARACDDYEPVTVTFRALYNGDWEPPAPDLKALAGGSWDTVKRKVVARSLVRALGPPGVYDYMTYDI
ncbi:hypothetical protein GGR52DRAFT_592348 [Hypoxylon sp. FL1284]|nr:hypothetical protein GGR52DRAFT_592348 [Hypoxylon sp. FL1284]